MPLVISLGRGDDFYVGKEQYIVEKIHSGDHAILKRGSDGKRITILSSRSSELLPGVLASIGLRASTTAIRIVIDAPPDLLVLRGENFRASPPKEN